MVTVGGAERGGKGEDDGLDGALAFEEGHCGRFAGAWSLANEFVG